MEASMGSSWSICGGVSHLQVSKWSHPGHLGHQNLQEMMRWTRLPFLSSSLWLDISAVPDLKLNV